jgi:hypothetical protein
MVNIFLSVRKGKNGGRVILKLISSTLYYLLQKKGDSSSSSNNSGSNSPNGSNNNSHSQLSNIIKKTSPSPSSTFVQVTNLNEQSQQSQITKLNNSEIHSQPPTSPPPTLTTPQNETLNEIKSINANTTLETKKIPPPVKFSDDKTTEEVRENLTLALKKNNYSNNFLNVDDNNNFSQSKLKPSQASEDNPDYDNNEQELNQSSTVMLIGLLKLKTNSSLSLFIF